MKRTYGILMSMLACTLILSGCGSAAVSQNTDSAVSSETAEASSAARTSSGDHQILVAYFSATGNTEAAAQVIADTVNADLFAIEPQDPYTEDDLNYNDANSRVSEEHEDPEKQDIALVSTEPENWDSYDIVFLGYPIWWQDAAWPVNHFVSDNDFTGKRVIPFCTSAASGVGDSAEHLSAMAGTGEWDEGTRFASGFSESEVSAWAEEAVQAS